jgi:hypothetical protein
MNVAKSSKMDIISKALPKMKTASALENYL